MIDRRRRRIMKITSISVQQKNKERYNIFIDEKYNF
ncbi:TPA_asm: recombination regulator RecX, partial [Listeria monocytogenes]|nr:recombination regulator RecX [Listeria monocytogenes]